MNAQDLRDAERLWGVLDNAARALAKKDLAPQLRTTGLESTLRWLEQKNQALGRALCDALGLPRERGDRGRRSNPEQLADSRRALALAEALHLFARARQEA